MSFLRKLFPSESTRFINKSSKVVNEINSIKATLSDASDGALKGKTKELKERLANGETLDDILPDAFATVCEVSKRTTGLYPFDVQLIGGMALHHGSIAEMRTGEGKTLVAVAPAYLNALSGMPVHIVTVNDYLARRDAVWMGQVYASLGLSIGIINGEHKSYVYDPGHKEKDKERDEKGSFKVVYDFLREVSRREAYACDIVYGTNNEFAFDYLRDNLEYEEEALRQRGLGLAIIDEVDSILIDEARTPLIISANVEIPASQYEEFARFAGVMVDGEDYTIDEKMRAVALTSAGIDKFEKALNIENVYVAGSERTIHFLENALKAKALYKKDKQYVVQGGKIVIVDESTGRLQPSRQWGSGMHQAIEAKERVAITQETRSVASIAFQNYFRMYEKLAGMTGTAKTSEEEFLKVYSLPVTVIPTNRPVKRADYSDVIYQTIDAKLKATVKKIKELNEKGQPVLVGTASIEHNEVLSKKLKKAKVPHQVLNAKNHEEEGEIIASAGVKGAVTIATNLAGRGVDIKLGGTDNIHKTELAKEIKELGGLFVLGTERHESRRVDNQLRGRCGRQGDKGETQFLLSLEDDLTRIFGGEKILALAQRLGLPEDHPIENRMITNAVESAQRKVEGHHFDSRRFNLEFDTVLNRHRLDVYTKRRALLCDKEVATLSEYISQEDMEGVNALELEESDTMLRKLLLHSIDRAWRDHLELMEYAKSSVNLRSYGQREPLMEYKREAVLLFSDFWTIVKEQIATDLKNFIEKRSKEKENVV